MKTATPRALDYYEISPEISERTAVFPGDCPYRRRASLEFKKGHHLDLSSIETTVHIGAHADAPSHYQPTGEGISARSLNYYLGPCQVVEVKVERGRRVVPEDLAKTKIVEGRVLFKTGSFADPERWSEEFNSLSPELVAFLHDRGAVLVGIDTPSIDPWDSKRLESHQAVFERDMAVLEGLVLEGVPAGRYTLVALPLRLKDADASPVRAILLKDPLK